MLESKFLIGDLVKDINFHSRYGYGIVVDICSFKFASSWGDDFKYKIYFEKSKTIEELDSSVLVKI